MSILIKNGNVLTKKGLVKADVLTEGGRIKKVAPAIDVKTDKVIDAAGLTVMPAFIDMHCHLREPGFEYKETIKSGGAAAVSGGFSTVCCMPNTNPPLDNKPLISYVVNKAKEVGIAKVYPIGAITKGRNGTELAEMGFMKEAGAIAVSDDGAPVANSAVMRSALEYAATMGLPVISHCEDKELSGEGTANEGYNATVAGLKGITRAAEEVMIARDIVLAETLGAPVHIAHVSTKGGVQLVREAKARGVKVTCETCPHYFSATDVEILNYNTSAKMNPPLRENADAEAIKAGLADGTIDVIATDHAPHNADSKSVEFNMAEFGTTGLETAFALANTYLVNKKVIDLRGLSRLMSARPAEILGLREAGEIAEGYAADITIADLNRKWKVDKDKMLSKGKNTLFHGWELTGKVVCTIVEGQIKFPS